MGAEWVVAAAGRVDLWEEKRRPHARDLAPVRASSKSAAAIGIIALGLDGRTCTCTV